MRGLSELGSMYILPKQEVGVKEVSGCLYKLCNISWYATLADKHYNLNNHCFHFAIYISHSSFGRVPGWGKTCKQCSIHSSWLLFPLYPTISFFTSILNCWPSFAASQWRSSDLDREIYRQLWERPVGCSAQLSLTKMPVWLPPPGLPECEWTLVNKTQTYTHTPLQL